MEWQPIETAPRDGARVDVWVVGWGEEPRRFTEAWFSNGHWWHAERNSEDYDVYSFDGGCVMHFNAKVTHWMPLPEPPANTSRSSLSKRQSESANR